MKTAALNLKHVPKSTPDEEIIAIVASDGGVIIEGFLPQDVVVSFNAEIDPYVEKRAPGTEGLPDGDTSWGLQTKRLTNLITRSETFRTRIVTDEKLFNLAKLQLAGTGDQFWMNTTQLINIGPGSLPQSLHRDLENYPVFREMGPAGPEVMCNFIFALTDFTEANGATRVIPGSNRWADFSLTCPRDPAATIPAEMRTGDALFFSGKMLHGGGANSTVDEWRRGVAVPFNPGWLVPEEAYPFLIDMEIARSLPPHVQQLIGFRTFTNEANYGGRLWMADYESLAKHLKLDA